MNDKKAKALRRIARQKSVGMPERNLLAKGTKRKGWHNGRYGAIASSQAFNDPQSTRGIYRLLKKSA